MLLHQNTAAWFGVWNLGFKMFGVWVLGCFIAQGYPFFMGPSHWHSQNLMIFQFPYIWRECLILKIKKPFRGIFSTSWALHHSSTSSWKVENCTLSVELIHLDFYLSILADGQRSILGHRRLLSPLNILILFCDLCSSLVLFDSLRQFDCLTLWVNHSILCHHCLLPPLRGNPWHV